MGVVLDEVLAFIGTKPWWAARPERHVLFWFGLGYPNPNPNPTLTRHVLFFMSGIGAGIVPTWRRLGLGLGLGLVHLPYISHTSPI